MSDSGKTDGPTAGDATPLATPPPGLGRKIIPFREIATCGDEVWIEYHGKLYRLQSTRQGKLVLTK